MQTISLKIPDELVARIEQFAENTDRSKSYVIRKAVEAFLTEQERYQLTPEQEKMVAEGIRDLDEGRYITIRGNKELESFFANIRSGKFRRLKK